LPFLEFDFLIKTASGKSESYVHAPHKTDVFAPFKIDFLTKRFVMRLQIVWMQIFCIVSTSSIGRQFLTIPVYWFLPFAVPL
jgi:hypothetical protein